MDLSGPGARGNQLTRSGSGTTQTRVFDHSERITSITGLASYYYDGHGRRTQTTRQDGSQLISVYTTDGVLRYQRDEAAQTTSHYVELGGTLVAEVERPFAPTGVPTITAPATSSTGNFTVSWSAVSGATSYQLEERLNSGSWSTIHNGTGTSKARTGRTTGTWGYRVRACNASGCGSYSAIKSTVVTLPPSGVPTLSGPTSAFAPASYTLSWTSVSGATSYQLEQRLNSGSWTTVHNGAGTSKAFSGVMAGSWGYRVRACNAAGCGAYSAIHTVWVDNIGGCNPPFCEDPDSVPGDPPGSW